MTRRLVRRSLGDGGLFVSVCVLLALVSLTARGISALGTRGLLDWDETYYTSTAATAAHGLGFYPYVLGYPQIPNMGGVGYVVSLYVLAYKLVGPQLIGLRIVSFIVSVLAVAGLGLLTRRLYGSAAGLVAIALAPSLLVFYLSNTIRLDVFAIAFAAWALLLYVHVADSKKATRWHVLLGTVCAFGLEVHLHTAAIACAIGIAYVVRTLSIVRRDGITTEAVAPIAGFVGGYAIGAAIFLIANVLPNPQGFFRTAALARLSAADSGRELNLTAPMDLSRLTQTFVSPAVIIKKELARYTELVRQMPWWETLLTFLALSALIIRRHADPYRWCAIVAGAIVGGAIVFNSPSALYFAAILPCFVPVIADFVANGFGKGAPVTLLVLTVAMSPTLLGRTAAAVRRARVPEPVTRPAAVDVVTRIASHECVLAGPTDLYAEYFMAYPKFVGARPVEVAIGSTYYGLQNDLVGYWRAKRPDIVIGPLGDGLADYLNADRYLKVADDVWRKPDNLTTDCVVTPPGHP
jgi:Dolichyl-phosphate-mannose-protein mannosyltransferase